MKSVRTFICLMVFLLLAPAVGWSQSAPARALDNVIIHTADGSTIEDGTIVWRRGIIESVGSGVEIPFDAYVIDGGDSLHVYPGFIDGLALWGSPDEPDEREQPERPGEPGYERAGIQPHRQPGKLLKQDDENLTKVRKLGFTTAALGLKGRMLPGQVDLFFINGSETGDYLIRKGIALSASFEEAGGTAYPSTLMGVMARFRQLWYDAAALKEQSQYYASVSSGYPAPAGDEVLEALYPVMENQKPLFFEVDTRENISRMFRLKDELGFDVVIVSGKEAFRQAGTLGEKDIPVLASIDLPDEPEWRVKEDEQEDPEEISEEMRIFRERQLQVYRAHIENIGKLMDAGVKVGFASNGMKPGDIKKKIQVLREEGGLSDNQILALFTRNTAEILGVGDRLGDLTPGRIASFTAFTRPFTEEEAQAVYSVSGGNLVEFEAEAPKQD